MAVPGVGSKIFPTYSSKLTLALTPRPAMPHNPCLDYTA